MMNVLNEATINNYLTHTIHVLPCHELLHNSCIKTNNLPGSTASEKNKAGNYRDAISDW